MSLNISKIYLHWSATSYDYLKPGHYHTIVDGFGFAHRLTPYSTPLYDATFCRNTNSVSLAVACMSPLNGTWGCPPTEAQLDGLAREVAKISLGLNWQADPIFLKHKIMTHAEAAANRDYDIELVSKFSNKSPSSDWDHLAEQAGLPHANYGPAKWHDGWPGGDVYRWDLWKLRESDMGGSGGFELRDMVVSWMKKITAQHELLAQKPPNL